MEKTVRHILKPLVWAWFWSIRWVIHNGFLIVIKNEAVGKASVISLPLVYARKVIRGIKRVWNLEFADYALKKYGKLLDIHYSAKGVGYLNFDKLSEQEQLDIYSNLKGRIAYFIKNNPTALTYRDGDTFLDVGCGKGQNIKELVTLFPNSKIKGFDLSEGALKVIQSALKNNGNIFVERGSVTDTNYMQSHEEQSFDHIIMSHVMSFLSGDGIEETRRVRQNLINELIRIASKTVLILDSEVLFNREDPEFSIEQNTRGVFKESLIRYFGEHAMNGELYVMFSSETTAFLYRKASTNK
jgi:ubiquinone/menaquinone biosynthesis C-methylase UbiE